MTKHAVRTATVDDLDGMARTMARAFLDDPLINYMFPDRAQRVRGLEPFFRVMIAASLRDQHEMISTTEGCTGVAMWRTPEHWKMPTRSALGLAPTILRRFGLRNSARAFGALTTIEKAHPNEPHWYLDGLGSDPDHQRSGVGSSLLAPILERCDNEGMPAYLECIDENVPYYRRHGFEVTGQHDFGSLTVWFMWRHPR
ncbi:MAG: GNAT family N-acetyltransferase [Acidimicrobiales bacterium]|nr:GNAT family N-acetyltransferase [Acidimicrobiales bacterium]